MPDLGKTSYDLVVTDKKYLNEDRYRNNIIARHSYIQAKLREGAFKGLLLGDSIAQGTGSSNILATIPQVLAGKLYNAYAGSGNAWSPDNMGVGGSTIANVLAYLSHAMNSTIDIAQGNAFTFPYWIINTGRNDCNLISDINVFSKAYRIAVRMGIRAGIDVICCTEPPYVDMVTKQVNDPNYPAYADEIRRIATQEGASLVDVHNEWLYQQKYLGVDLTTLTVDGTHPNDAGYAIIGDLIYRCMTGQSVPVNRRNAPNAPKRLGYHVLSQYNLAATSSGATTQAVSGLTTASTSRARQTGTNDVVNIPAGSYADFTITKGSAVEFVIITILQATSGAGTATVSCPTSTTIASGISGNGAAIREFSTLISGIGSPSSVETVRVTAVGAAIQITGVHVITTIPSVTHDTIRGTEAGLWSDLVSTSLTWRSSSTVSDTTTIKWYGTDLCVDIERKVDRGQFSYQTDGGATNTFDCYLNASTLISRLNVAIGLSNGWHTTVLTVVAKNVSSSANTVTFRNTRIYSPVPIDGTIVAMSGAGITVYLPDGQNYVRTQTGTPTISGITATNTAGGVIEAVVK